MRKFIAVLGLLMCFIVWGCNRSREHTYVTETAPVTTYSVVHVDTFGVDEQQQINDSIAAVISALLADRPDVTVVNNITINVTNTQIGPFNGKNPNHKNILVYCGEDFECPELYEKLFTYLCGEREYEREAPRCKERGRQLTSDNANRNRGRRHR